ncbi:hypothetical protein [Parvularcula maris]|uniref:Uncharacterized protein n=1 Tax=Parvularcula maris TaxID=2965077 RepID=A0A9X2RKV0_9PROT|nr:hypothetical protein [Parvularcula maris]MCQ8186153.1 hypothetical protein [Parvularcula maris]
MQLRSAVYFILFAFLPGLGYQYVQDQLRPRGGLDGAAAYLAGVAPNFLGGVSLTAGLIVIALNLFPKAPRMTTTVLTALISLMGLLGWEVLQRWMPGGTFDPADLLWTVPGVVLSAAAAFPFLKVSRKDGEE